MSDQITMQPGVADTAPSTRQQPSHALSNIFAHPGSTWAGVGVALATVAGAINAQGLPTTAGGWITFVASLLVALMAALGK
jgi:hypothetical protein